MTHTDRPAPPTVVVERVHFQRLFEVLHQKGYRTIGPTLRDGAIVYDEIEGVSDLPVGWTDEQEAALYRIKKRTDDAHFGYVVGPHSWKKFLFPPRVKLWSARKTEAGFQVETEPEEIQPMAFIGVRSCELHALTIQKQVFTSGQYTDSRYQVRSHNLFIVAVNCTVVGGTCFCASMQTGPKATAGYDLAVTEIQEADRHYFVVEAGTDAGMEVLNQIPHQTADPAETTRVDALMTQSASQMGRTLNTENIKDLLYRNSESPIWEAIAQRCLTCANCTLVCPTCFCSTVEDVTDLTGDIAERWRRWDSCFTVEFSYIHGGPVRSSPESRYRQWMTHKLASWIDQFGTSGCVGCGRCITWCPVGIDITKEVQTFRESEK